MKPQKGDIVHIKATVVTVGNRETFGTDHIFVNVDSTRMFTGWVRPEDIIKIEERPLAVGDRVRFPAHTFDLKILAINEPYAWLYNPETGAYSTGSLKGLERAP